MRKFIAAAAAVVALAGLSLGLEWNAPASAAPTPGLVQFHRIQFDAPGSPDNGSAASLNGEYVQIVNGTGRNLNTLNWKLRDAAGHVFVFPSHALPAGGYVLVRTGPPSPSSVSVFWNSGSHIWNNGGDTADLYANTGTRLDHCAWTSRGTGYKYC